MMPALTTPALTTPALTTPVWHRSRPSGRKALATFCPAPGQDLAATDRGGTGTESMAALANQPARLKCAFHLLFAADAALAVQDAAWRGKPLALRRYSGFGRGADSQGQPRISRARYRVKADAKSTFRRHLHRPVIAAPGTINLRLEPA